MGDDYVSKNPFWRARLMDDEIAIAIAFEKMAAYVRGEGEGPYSFAEGAQDQYLSLLMIEAAQTGEVRKSVRQPWAAESSHLRAGDAAHCARCASGVPCRRSS